MKKLVNSNSLCLACISLPAIGFGTGLLAIAFPIAVLYTAMAVIGAGWIGALRWVIRADCREAADANGAGSGLAILGTLFGLSAGLLAGGEGTVNVPVLLIAFTLGLVGGLVFRARRSGAGKFAGAVPVRA